MQKGKGNTGGFGQASATAPDVASLQQLLKPETTPEQFCKDLAKIFKVRPTEVALLRLEKGLLKFLHPAELATAGSIPVSSSTAVAAHTAVTKKVELFNGFTKVKHASIFETVKLGKPEEDHQIGDHAPIQKLMSAPILDGKRSVLGVLQISRKGLDVSLCGADFTLTDLQHLEAVTGILSKATFLQIGAK